jgi:hypothetical protein
MLVTSSTRAIATQYEILGVSSVLYPIGAGGAGDIPIDCRVAHFFTRQERPSAEDFSPTAGMT